MIWQDFPEVYEGSSFDREIPVIPRPNIDSWEEVDLQDGELAGGILSIGTVEVDFSLSRPQV